MNRFSEIYLLKGTCIPITGFNRGIVYSLVDKTYHYIPKKYSMKLEKSRIVTERFFSDEAISFFINQNLIMKVKKNQIKQFPQMNLEYVSKKDIEHVIIEVDNSRLDLLEKIMIQLKPFKIRSFEFLLANDDLRNRNISTLNYLKNVLNEQKALNIDHATYLSLKDDFDFSSFDYIKQYSYFGNEKLVKGHNEYHYTDIEYWKMDHKKCYFDFDFFTESLHRHPIFNKMLFIDREGNVKQTALGGAISSYKELGVNTLNELSASLLWNITKNKCDVCVDCEYRHMCIDARIPVLNKDAIWHFDSECNYNPYVSKWKGECDWISIDQWREKNLKH